MTLQLPADGVSAVSALLALLIFGLCFSPRFLGKMSRLAPRVQVMLTGVLAAALSAGYIVHYLGGDARVIDATSYRLQAETFASGQLALKPSGPLHSFLGRFLVATPDGELAVIFPPGNAAFLAPFTWLDHPLWFGPVIAAALVVATYKLALDWFSSPELALTAALASALSGTLRYHTAEPMSHGICALLLTLFLLAASKRWATGAGLACGALFLCRPLSGAAVAVCFGLREVSRARSSPQSTRRRLVRFGLPVGFAVAAYVTYQERITGHLFSSAQHLYYSLADGPIGCFDLGLGANRGCQYEHGDFLTRYMPAGYGGLEALATSGRRLSLHANDALNGAWVWLSVLVITLARGGMRQPIVQAERRALTTIAVLSVVYVGAYAMFYFDGNYPGGGARMFAELIPLEHIVFAWLLNRARALQWAAPLLLLGFALSGSAGHRDLKLRQGGSPMHEPGVLSALPREPAILFTNTDHAFNLAFTPSKDQRLTVARLREDRFDFSLWQHLGRPKAYKYLFDPFGKGNARVVPYAPKDTARFEAESAWPLLAVAGGFAMPSSLACASQGRVLELNPGDSGEPFTLTMNLWATRGGIFRLTAVADQPLELAIADQALGPATDDPRPPSQETSRCERTLRRQSAVPLQLEEGEHSVSVSVRRRATLDYLELTPGAL